MKQNTASLMVRAFGHSKLLDVEHEIQVREAKQVASAEGRPKGGRQRQIEPIGFTQGRRMSSSWHV